MLQIENTLVSLEIFKEKFCCDLSKCKGGCCEDGDAGPRISDAEKKEIESVYPLIKSEMEFDSIQTIEEHGLYEFHNEFGWVTPTAPSGICVYGKKDSNGVIVCLFEKYYNAGLIPFKKPLSCHLFPIIVTQSTIQEDLSYINFEPRETLCNDGCSLGNRLKIPVYIFLKEPLIRKFGESFYAILESFYQESRKE